MKPILVILGVLAAGCGVPPSPGKLADRHQLEVIVADCDRGSRQHDCDAARRSLGDARREARTAAYRDAF